MAIKYICDFCKSDCNEYHYEIQEGSGRDKKIICNKCYDHLVNQTWRLSEEYKYFTEKKKELEEREIEVKKREDQENYKEETSKCLSKRYRNGMYTAISLYNTMVDIANSVLPKTKGFGFFQINIPEIQKIDLGKLYDIEDDAIRESFRNAYGSWVRAGEMFHNNKYFDEELDFKELPKIEGPNGYYGKEAVRRGIL